MAIIRRGGLRDTIQKKGSTSESQVSILFGKFPLTQAALGAKVGNVGRKNLVPESSSYKPAINEETKVSKPSNLLTLLASYTSLVLARTNFLL